MAEAKPKNEARRQHILDLAQELFTHHGYDKTTMSDIAKAAGIGRGVLYLQFESKDAVFEALLMRAMLAYGRAWVQHVQADPKGGTLGGMYRAFLLALAGNPFMTLVIRQDPQLLGQYIRKPGNMLTSLGSPTVRADFMPAMHAVGAIRQDIDPSVGAYILDMLSIGLVMTPGLLPGVQPPPFEQLIETLGEMLDRLLLPEDGGNSEAGKALVRQAADEALKQYDKLLNKDTQT